MLNDPNQARKFKLVNTQGNAAGQFVDAGQPLDRQKNYVFFDETWNILNTYPVDYRYYLCDNIYNSSLLHLESWYSSSVVKISCSGVPKYNIVHLFSNA